MKEDAAPSKLSGTDAARAAKLRAGQPAPASVPGGLDETERILNCVAAGVFKVSSDGTITYANAQARRLVTVGEPLGRTVRGCESDTVWQDGTPCAFEDLPPIKCLRTGEFQPPVTIGLRSPEQRYQWVTVTAAPLLDPKTGKPESALVTVVDSSHPIHVEASLRQSEDRYRRLVELAPDAIVVHRGGPMVYVNNAGVKLWGGRSRDDFIGRNVLDFIHPDDLAMGRQRVARAMSGESTELIVQRHVRLDGTEVTVEVTGASCIYEGLPAVQVIFRDVSRRIEVEHELRRAKAELEQRVEQRTEELSRKNAELQRKQRFMERALERHERDRKLVAYEIHDTILQDVIGALMFVDTAVDAAGDARKGVSLQRARDLLRRCIDGSRRMISGLRPPIIDEQGVSGSIEYLVNELGSRGVEISFSHSMQTERLAGELETTIFRIVQEALANIERHSGADCGEVSIVERDGTIRIEVRDRGAGFDTEQVVEGHYGLEGIRERARLSGGWASIDSTVGEGTSVIVELPVVLESPAGSVS